MASITNLKRRERMAVAPPKQQAKGTTRLEPASPEVAVATPTARAKLVLFKELIARLVAPLFGMTIFLLVWAMASHYTTYLPSPAKVWVSAVELLADPFYVKNKNDVGIGWNLLNSLQRVALGFGLAALIGVPLGFMIGRFVFLRRAMAPLIAILKPVSPLAWLPIGLALFQAAGPSSVFVIFISCIWPMIINTALGVGNVAQDYLNVARVLRLSEWKVFTKILLPACLPFVMTGMRLALGIAWLVIVAAEMLTGGVGIGFWVWDEWNNLNMEHIIIAIFIVGLVGLIIEQGMMWIANRFDYRH